MNHFDLGIEFHTDGGNGTIKQSERLTSSEMRYFLDTVHVLLIEKPGPDFQDLADRLHHIGFVNTEHAVDGKAAIQTLSEMCPDVVLMNVALDRELNGVMVSELIQSTHGIPVIFITTSSDDELEILAALPAGSTYIIKPCRDRELKTAINLALLKNRKALPEDPANEEKCSADTWSDIRKMEPLGLLAGGIAHDFSNIIGAIIGYTQLSLLDITSNSQHKENLERVLQAGKRAKELLKQILIFSQRADRELKPVNLLPIVKEVLRFLRSTIPSSIEIRQDWQTPNPVILGDPTEVYQLLMNLCTNAANAMRDKGGRLDVRLSENTLKGAKTKGTFPPENRNYLTIEIQDSGHGIDTAILPRIFDPYFTTRHQSEGAGMGLAVVHGIVNSYGGRIEVVSKPQQGALFRIHLPIYHNGRLDKHWTPAADVKALNVLFVDDEEALVSLGERMLARLGHHTIGFTSAAEALNAFRADPNRFDVVIADQTMPRMTGLELVREIGRQRPEIPVILCTGLNRDVCPEDVRAAGIKYLLLKPLVMEELAQALESMTIEKTNAGLSPHSKKSNH